MVLRGFVFLMMAVSLCSCDCFVKIDGKILSLETGEPLEGVHVKLVDQEIASMTGAEGNFTVSKQMGFCIDPEISISKVGYKPFFLKVIGKANDISFQIKKHTEYVELDQPIYPDPNNSNTYIITIPRELYSQDFWVKGDSIIIFLSKDQKSEEVKRAIEDLISKWSLGDGKK